MAGERLVFRRSTFPQMNYFGVRFFSTIFVFRKKCSKMPSCVVRATFRLRLHVSKITLTGGKGNGGQSSSIHAVSEVRKIARNFGVRLLSAFGHEACQPANKWSPQCRGD